MPTPTPDLIEPGPPRPPRSLRPARAARAVIGSVRLVLPAAMLVILVVASAVWLVAVFAGGAGSSGRDAPPGPDHAPASTAAGTTNPGPTTVAAAAPGPSGRPSAARPTREVPLGPADAGFESRLAAVRVAFNEQRFADARRLIEPLLASPAAPQDVLTLAGQIGLGLRDHAWAYGQMASALARGPESAGLHFDAGTVASMAGQLDQSLAHYTRAGELDAANPRVPLYRAMVHLKRGDEAAARADLQRVLTLEPASSEAWGTLAELSLRVGDAAGALTQASAAQRGQPESVRWRLVEARALLSLGRAADAAGVLAALPEPARADAAVLTLIERCAEDLGQPLLAARAYAAAAGAAARQEGQTARAAEAHEHAARWFARGGDRAEARRHARAAIGLGRASARELLKDLENVDDPDAEPAPDDAATPPG